MVLRLSQSSAGAERLENASSKFRWNPSPLLPLSRELNVQQRHPGWLGQSSGFKRVDAIQHKPVLRAPTEPPFELRSERPIQPPPKTVLFQAMLGVVLRTGMGTPQSFEETPKQQTPQPVFGPSPGKLNQLYPQTFHSGKRPTPHERSPRPGTCGHR